MLSNLRKRIVKDNGNGSVRTWEQAIYAEQMYTKATSKSSQFQKFAHTTRGKSCSQPPEPTASL